MATLEVVLTDGAIIRVTDSVELAGHVLDRFFGDIDNDDVIGDVLEAFGAEGDRPEADNQKSDVFAEKEEFWLPLAQAQTLQVFQDNAGYMDAWEVAEELGIKPSAANARIRSLRRSGSVVGGPKIGYSERRGYVIADHLHNVTIRAIRR